MYRFLLLTARTGKVKRLKSLTSCSSASDSEMGRTEQPSSLIFWPNSIQYNIQCALCQCGDGPTIYIDFWPSSITFLSLAVSEMSYRPSRVS